MPLLRLHKFNAAKAAAVVKATHKKGNPEAVPLLAAERPVEIIRPVFNDSK